MAVVSLIVLLPLIGGAVLALTTFLEWRRGADLVALGIAVAVVVLGAVALARSADHVLVEWMGGWRPRGGVAVGIDLYVDPLAAGLATFAAFLTVVALVVSLRRAETWGHLLQALLLLFLAGAVGFVLAGDLFTMFVFFELMSVAGFALAGLLVEQRAPIEGALNFAVTNTAGSFAMLTGIALLYGRNGALNLAQIGAALHDSDATVAVAFALIAVGFLVKAAIVPFHFWLADAYTAAPVEVCVLFAGVMSELGLYGVARVYWTVFEAPLGGDEALVRGVLLGLAAATAAAGALMAIVQRLLKRMLAFATIAHMGVMLFGVALLGADGIGGLAIYVVGDGLVKAGLFVAAGVLLARHGTDDIGALHGRGRRERLLGVLFAAGALALAGLPPFGPFLGRALIDDGATALGHAWVPWLLAAVGVLTGGAVLRAAGAIFLALGRPLAGDPLVSATEERPGPMWPLWIPAVALLALGLAWGLVPGLVDAVTRAAALFTEHEAYARTVIDGAPAALPDVPGKPPTTAAYLFGAGAAVAALAFGALPRLPRAPAAAGRLRDLHSGRATDYLAWLATGAALLTVIAVLGLR
jgi:multicomponent Na+:H+ antiporter subunit D